ncbi:MAG: hypothetical protein ACEPOZ_19570 [Marinifilaceae bacterium]
MNRVVKLIALSLLVGFFSACDKDDDHSEPQIEGGDVLMSTMVPNPDGRTCSVYMQLIDNKNLEAASYTNATAIPAYFACPPVVVGDDVYLLPGWAMESDLLKKYSRIGGKLVEQGSLTLPAQSGANNLVVKGEKAYISLSMKGKILIVNPNTLAKLGEIDIKKYGVGDENPDPAMMIIRGKYLYVGLNQLLGGYYPAPDRACSDVLIIDTEKDEVVKMITESASGISMPTKPEADCKSIFMDENKDIYVVGIAGFGAVPGHKSGILRIRNGATDFDSDYQFVLTGAAIEGEEYVLDYLCAVQYAGKGKLYAAANVPAYYKNPDSPDYIKDRTIIAVEIDLNAKTIKKLDIPRSNTYGASVSLYKDDIVFGFSTTEDNGYFTYNPSTGKASSHAVISVEGFPNEFRAFGSQY